MFPTANTIYVNFTSKHKTGRENLFAIFNTRAKVFVLFTLIESSLCTSTDITLI